MGGDGVDAEIGHVVERRAQADGAGDVRCAGLELVGQVVVGRFFEAHAADHVAAALVRVHLLQQLAFAVQHADARGTEDLVSGERVKIRIQGLHVDGQMRCRLGAVEQHHGAGVVGRFDDGFDRIDRAERVGYVHHGDDAGLRPEHLQIGIHVQLAFVAYRDHLELGARLSGEHLPGNDVGVMLHGGDDDLVAFLETRAPVALRHQVDAFGAAAHQYHFAAIGSVDESLGRVSGTLVVVGRPLAQGVHAAMHVGIVPLVVVTHGIDDAAGLLTGGAVIQIDERMAIHLLMQNREILADLVHVVQVPARLAGNSRYRVHCTISRICSAFGMRWSNSSVSFFSSGAKSTRSRMSRANPYVSRARAWASPMPRERR